MKQFHCQCGQPVFFESDSCIDCGAILGFDPAELNILSLRRNAEGLLVDTANRKFRLCDNGTRFGVCNWLQPAWASHPLCWGCQFNRTIPCLDNAGNILRWGKLEAGKKRLLYTLRQLALPVVNGFDDADRGLLFDFVEDQRSNANSYPETFLQTGHHAGVITINAIEADDVAREAVRIAMNESYRTVLGHLRHESGHYYWSLIETEPSVRSRFIDLFGNVRRDYAQALEFYYANGPVPDWQRHHISPYASSHPAEDWAETWGHYLHIFDAIETAEAYKAIALPKGAMSFSERIRVWRGLSITLNELNRSVGLGDAYPFVVNSVVEEKLNFVDTVINHLQRYRLRRVAQ